MAVKRKPTYLSFGYAYPSSNYSWQFGRQETGCWFWHVGDSTNGDYGERGPFETLAAAVASGQSAHPTLEIGAGTRAWVSQNGVTLPSAA